MYCPSCDKSYGAVHSRCPECHSWLKVSAPANSRAKTATKAASAVSPGVVSTLDKEPAAWAEPPVSGAGDWGKGVSDSWNDALPVPTTPSFPSEPAPAAGSWGGGGAWGGAPTSDSWSETEPSIAKTPAPAMSPLVVPATSPTPSGGAWLSDSSGDDWGAGPSAIAPSTPSLASGLGTTSLSLAGKDDDGWSGGVSTPPIAPAPSLASPKSLGGLDAADGDGWGGASASPIGASAPVKPTLPPPSQGWLGGVPEPVAGEDESVTGWLGDSRTTKVGSAVDSDGWLSGESPTKAPSMTEMVDRAIGVEEADDFVDDSWVDEEVGHGEFDDLEVPEYVPPTPEIGGLFLKMLLVAALVLLVGGGVMFLGQEKKTDAQLKAEAKAKDLVTARSFVESGRNYLKEGQPLLAVGPLEAAMTSLKTAGGTEAEIFEAKADLAKALMKAQQYQKAHDQWAGLAKGPEKYRKNAKAQMVESSKLLRAQATAELAEAAGYIKNGEASSVLDLGRSALSIYEKHKGTASQKGKAYGVIGRGYLNGKEYGKARENLKKALSLNPAGGYSNDLAQIAQLTAPVNYHSGGGSYTSYPQDTAPRQVTPIVINASIGDGPSYATSTATYSGGGSRRAPSSASAPAAAPAAPARTRSAPAPSRPSAPRSGGGRKGSKNVVPGYDS